MGEVSSGEKRNRHNFKGEVVLELLLIQGEGMGLADGRRKGVLCPGPE